MVTAEEAAPSDTVSVAAPPATVTFTELDAAADTNRVALVVELRGPSHMSTVNPAPADALYDRAPGQVLGGTATLAPGAGWVT